MAQLLASVSSPSSSASDSSPCAPSDTGSPSTSDLESETDAPLSSTPISDFISSSVSSGDDEPTPQSPAETNVDVMKHAGERLTYSESLLLLLRYSLVHTLTKKRLKTYCG